MAVLKASGEVACFHFYRNGEVAINERHGVAIAQAALLAWGPISPRRTNVRIKGATVDLTGILLHIPAFEAEKEARCSRRFMMTGSVDHRIC